jgi:hypothetical protein
MNPIDETNKTTIKLLMFNYIVTIVQELIT